MDITPLKDAYNTMKRFASEFAFDAGVSFVISLPLTMALFSKCGEIDCGYVKYIAIVGLAVPAAIVGGIVSAIVYTATGDFVLELLAALASSVLTLLVLYMTKGKELKQKATAINSTIISTLQLLDVMGGTASNPA